MKKVILLGFDAPVKKKSKSFVLKALYKRAKKNPFISDKSYKEYLEYLKEQIEFFNDTYDLSSENKIYDSLKKIGWIKVIGSMIAIVSVNTGV
jgi:ubiquinone/menaquinone biosynthesis C-methylase UbiE